MLLVPDPITEGFVTTLARPGGNVTGLTIFVPSFVQKYVELLREAVPSASRFVVLGNPGGPTPEIRAELESAARTFGIMLSIIPVSGPDEIDAALARAKREGAAGIIDPPNYVTFIYRRQLAQTALKYGMPGIYWAREYAQDGGLLTYSPDMNELRRRAATFVDKILKGAKPAELPVEQPRKFELVINLKTAKALGLDVPLFLRQRADEVIE